ncbi:MAG: TrmB family transcriptional regulator [Halodesulfurarchaeum sp.]
MGELVDLGLRSYEDDAYRSLIDLGSATAADVAAASGVPEGRIYDVLSDLETRGLVRVQTASRPKRYVAVEPDVAVERLVESRRSELQAEIERYQSLGNELKAKLQGEADVQDPFWTTAIGTDDAIELLFERVDVADSQVVMVAETVPTPIDLDEVGPDILDRLAAAVERGVHVSLLISEAVVAEAPGRLLERLEDPPFDTDQFSIRITPTLYGSLYLIDREELCVGFQNPIDPEEILGLINVKDPGFVLELETQFRNRWKRSKRVESMQEQTADFSDA